MSYKATAWAYDLPLKGPAKIVLVALADFADEAGSCYPGQEKLCQMTGLSIRTLRRALERLEDNELITRERRFDRFGHRTSDRYYLQIDRQSLPVTVTGGQSDLGSESPSLPVRESIPTGHSDRVTIRRTTRDPSGGASATQPVDNSTVVPWCTRHAATQGSDTGCAACQYQRIAWAKSLAAETAAAVTEPTRQVKHIPGLCDDHRQPETTCEMCERENRQAAEVIHAQFGGAA